MDDFVEDVDDLVDVVDERGVEDDDDDLDSVFLANLPCLYGGVNSVTRRSQLRK